MDNLTQSTGKRTWAGTRASRFPCQCAPEPAGHGATHHEPLLEWLQVPAAPLDEDTQVTSGLENSPGQLLWINTQGVLEGGGGAAEDRQLFKPAANPLQPLTWTQPHAFVQADSKLAGIQELKYTKDIYANTCQKAHFPSASWLFSGWQEGFHLAFTGQALPPRLKIPQLTLLQEVFEAVHGHVFVYAHSLPSLLSSGPRATLSSQVSSEAIFKHSTYKSSKKGVSNGNADRDLKRQHGNDIIYYTSASLAADTSLPHLRFPLVYFG